MKFILTCGGTAGHINPALAVAGRLRELLPDSSFLFIGAEGKMEMELVPREGYDIVGLKMTNISRGHSLDAILHNIDTLKNVAVSTHEAKKIIRAFKPDVVIGTGGYGLLPGISSGLRLLPGTYRRERTPYTNRCPREQCRPRTYDEASCGPCEQDHGRLRGEPQTL